MHLLNQINQLDTLSPSARWRDEHDEFIIRRVYNFGDEIYWKAIAKLLKRRTPRVKDRWYTKLDPTLDKKGWSMDQ